MESTTDRDALELLRGLEQVRDRIDLAADQTMVVWDKQITRNDFRLSAGNLASYLAMRHADLRHIQRPLAPPGLSSLGRCEVHVLPTLDAVIASLSRISGWREA